MVYTVENYLAFERNGILTNAVTWMNLEGIV